MKYECYDLKHTIDKLINLQNLHDMNLDSQIIRS